MHKSAGPPRVQQTASDIRELELPVIVSCCTWVLGSKLGPLREQCVPLAAEPPLGWMSVVAHTFDTALGGRDRRSNVD